MNDLARNFFSRYEQRSNTVQEKLEIAQKAKAKRLPTGIDTLSCSFRLRGDEIRFLESLPGDSLTEKLRQLLTWGRGIGTDITMPTISVDVIYAMVERIERLESNQKQHC
jgi:hypothetical protein